jgi:hypothetical protein
MAYSKPKMWANNHANYLYGYFNKFTRNYLEYPTCNPGAFIIEVNSLKFPYREFAWLFARILGLESTMLLSRNVIYAMHYSLHEKSIIDWGYHISNEISFQLNNLKKT